MLSRLLMGSQTDFYLSHRQATGLSVLRNRVKVDACRDRRAVAGRDWFSPWARLNVQSGTGVPGSPVVITLL
jgi:hypothetical protein